MPDPGGNRNVGRPFAGHLVSKSAARYRGGSEGLMKQRAFLVLLVVGAAITPAGCSHFDTTRRAAPRLTLGEEIVRVFCERMASEANPSDVMGLRWRPVCRGEAPPPVDAPRRLVVLMEHRTRLARALDQVLPEAEIGDDLGHFLGELMPLMDNPSERVPASTRLLADFLDRLSSDDAAIDALSRMGTREGYRPLRLALGVVRPFRAYPEFDQFAELALRTLTDLAGSQHECQQHQAGKICPQRPAPHQVWR